MIWGLALAAYSPPQRDIPRVVRLHDQQPACQFANSSRRERQAVVAIPYRGPTFIGCPWLFLHCRFVAKITYPFGPPKFIMADELPQAGEQEAAWQQIARTIDGRFE